MDVTDAAQAKIAEEAGVCTVTMSDERCIRVSVMQACAVMALERVPADIRRDGGVARMSDPKVTNINIGLQLMFLVAVEN